MLENRSRLPLISYRFCIALAHIGELSSFKTKLLQSIFELQKQISLILVGSTFLNIDAVVQRRFCMASPKENCGSPHNSFHSLPLVLHLRHRQGRQAEELLKVAAPYRSSNFRPLLNNA